MINKNRFTLIELLVVIAIIGVLAVLLIGDPNSAGDKVKTENLQAGPLLNRM